LEVGSLPWADSRPWWGDGSCVGNMFDTILSCSLGIAVYQDHYGGHYRKENSHPCNDAVKKQTPKSGWCSLTLGVSEHQRGELCRGEEGEKLNLKAVT
jgi:hypothetical protein